MYWLKFNIYSNFLTAIALFLLSMFIFIPALHQYWWEYFIFIPIVFFIQKFADNIYASFQHKMDVRNMLIEKSRENFDQRRFIPYMDSPCMRNVVYFTLVDLGRQKEYKIIKKRAANKRKCNICHSNSNISKKVFGIFF